jgi:maltose alpha-D-glucosyltransferase/alpha-amylase
VDLIDCFPLRDGSTEYSLYLLLIHVAYAEGEPDAYCVPISLLNEEAANELLIEHPKSGILKLELGTGDEALTLCEATWDDNLWTTLIKTIAERKRLRGFEGAITGTRTAAFSQLLESPIDQLPPSVHGGEQSNTSATFDGQFILKLFRKVTFGTNPDLEIGRQLTESHDLPIVPKVAGAVEYEAPSGRHMTLGILHQFVPSVGDAWQYALDELNRYFERVQTTEVPASDADAHDSDGIGERLLTTIKTPILDLAEQEPPPLAQDMIGGFLSWAELLGRRVGELHVALANASGGGGAFAPEPFTRLYQRSLYQSMRSQARSTLELLRSQMHRLNEEAQTQASQTLQCERALYATFSRLTHGLINAQRIRCHGDLHSGQVLFTGKDFVIIDFEGEPERPVSERRIKASPLRDVAGMLRSFHYAAHAALRGQTQTLIMQHAAVPIEHWANFWSAWVSAAFLRTYLEEVKAGKFLPEDHSQLNDLLRAYLLEKALYELRYELNNRPDWVNIPLQGIGQYCGDPENQA